MGRFRTQCLVLFLEKMSREQGLSFSTQDFLILDRLHRGQPIPGTLKPRISHLVEAGALESIGRGRGTHYVLSRRFYAMTGRKGIYTRKVSLDKETHKALLLKHIRANAAEGTRMQELQQVLPGLSRQQIQRLLSKLATAGNIQRVGIKRAARWYPIEAD